MTILFLLGSGAGFLLINDPKWMILCGTLTAGISIAGLYFYARRFDRGKFDLIPMENPEATPQ